MKLTKLQRYTAYILLLDFAKKNDIIMYNNFGFCYTWSHFLGGIYHHSLHKALPELYKKRTTGLSNMYWFYNWKQRIDALKQCIKETEPK